eukprot:m.198319 g.198319  ORF g.198319 m.198319 type:complete len:456 (+) comp32689_c0_seq5:544-1911(+)
MPRWILFGFMVSMHADTSTTLSTGTTTTRGTGSVSARLSAVGDANLLPFLQVQARYTGEETVGWPHLEPRASVIVPYNWSAICADPKRPRDVCSAPPLDLNDGNKVSRYLPYLNFNQFRTERTPTKIPTITLSDHKLKVDITPQFGGKVYAMTDVPTGRSLLHTPKIHQPIIAARLDAQVDGGIEWNWSPGKLGHWVGTEQDVYAAQLDTVKGPMVRVYEYDRWNQTVFQVDMIVQNGTLFAHPKVTNPHAHNITGYWWTCVGMKLTSNTSECHSSHETKGTRVLTPAAYNVNDALEAIPWPNVTNAGGNTDNRSHDMSFLSSWSTGGDNFVRILSPTRPHVTVIDKDIFGPTGILLTERSSGLAAQERVRKDGTTGRTHRHRQTYHPLVTTAEGSPKVDVSLNRKSATVQHRPQGLISRETHRLNGPKYSKHLTLLQMMSQFYTVLTTQRQQNV